MLSELLCGEVVDVVLALLCGLPGIGEVHDRLGRHWHPVHEHVPASCDHILKRCRRCCAESRGNWQVLCSKFTCDGGVLTPLDEVPPRVGESDRDEKGNDCNRNYDRASVSTHTMTGAAGEVSHWETNLPVVVCSIPALKREREPVESDACHNVDRGSDQ